jgi:beta-galactosidase GanA
VPQRANDPYLLAWQTDNENNFANVGLTKYLQTYAAGPGGAQAIAFLQARYPTLAAINAAWGTSAASWASLGAALPAPHAAAFHADDLDWQGEVVDRYLNVSTTAIRRHDPNHLISGVRFNYNTPQITA